MDKFYHGTDLDSAKNICDNGIDLHASSLSNDFGPGFYLTDDFERAKKWAIRKANSRSTKAAIVTVLFDFNSAAPFIEKFSDDLRWARFVINNRNGGEYIKVVPFKDNNLDCRYDMTYGRVADLDVTDIADELQTEKRMITELEIRQILNPKYPIQLVLHSELAKSFVVKTSYSSSF